MPHDLSSLTEALLVQARKAGADAADALAIAICHAHHLQSAGRLQAALRKAAG